MTSSRQKLEYGIEKCREKGEITHVDCFELSKQLLETMIPQAENSEIAIPLTQEEFRVLFRDARAHYESAAWSCYSSVILILEDKCRVRVNFGDPSESGELTCEISDGFHVNAGSSNACKSGWSL